MDQYIRRRYLSETKAAEIRMMGARMEWQTSTLAVGLDILTLDRLEWVVVPDDDPRVGTYELERI